MSKIKTLYLAGPINGRSDSDARDWRQEVTELWSGAVMDPMARDYRGREMDPGIAEAIVRGDLRDIACSDAMLVYFDKPSVGTAMEVFYAATVLRLPVIVINASGKPLSPWLFYHSTVQVETVAAALQWAIMQ